MTALADHRDPRWTPAQLEHLAEFEAAPDYPIEVALERLRLHMDDLAARSPLHTPQAEQ